MTYLETLTKIRTGCLDVLATKGLHKDAYDLAECVLEDCNAALAHPPTPEVEFSTAKY